MKWRPISEMERHEVFGRLVLFVNRNELPDDQYNPGIFTLSGLRTPVGGWICSKGFCHEMEFIEKSYTHFGIFELDDE